jgi:hypothetical protein
MERMPCTVYQMPSEKTGSLFVPFICFGQTSLLTDMRIPDVGREDPSWLTVAPWIPLFQLNLIYSVFIYKMQWRDDWYVHMAWNSEFSLGCPLCE